MTDLVQRPLRPAAATATAPVRALVSLGALATALIAIEWAGAITGAPPLMVWGGVSASLVAAACGWAAARAFARGDHLRRAWALNGAMYLILALGRTLEALPLGLPRPLLTALLTALMLAANAAEVGCAVTFALTWRRTGLPLPGSRATQVAAGSLLAATSLAIVGPDLVHCLAGAARGDLLAAAAAVGDASDAVAFLLVLPVFLTARALAGGSLAWPFALLTASQICWMLLDAVLFLRDSVVASPALATPAALLLGTLTCLLSAAAALSQRRALRP